MGSSQGKGQRGRGGGLPGEKEWQDRGHRVGLVTRTA